MHIKVSACVVDLIETATQTITESIFCVMTLVGWPERGALVFILPDIWASALVCLFKLAQQGPEVARVIFVFLARF